MAATAGCPHPLLRRSLLPSGHFPPSASRQHNLLREIAALDNGSSRGAEYRRVCRGTASVPFRAIAFLRSKSARCSTLATLVRPNAALRVGRRIRFRERPRLEQHSINCQTATAMTTVRAISLAPPCALNFWFRIPSRHHFSKHRALNELTAKGQSALPVIVNKLDSNIAALTALAHYLPPIALANPWCHNHQRAHRTGRSLAGTSSPVAVSNL